MVTGRAARRPGRAGPELPGPRAFTGLNGPKEFSFKCFLCIVRGQVSTSTAVQWFKTVMYSFWTNDRESYNNNFEIVIYGRTAIKISTQAVNGLSKPN